MAAEDPMPYPTEHHFQENYSGRNPVPTIQNYEHLRDLQASRTDENSINSTSTTLQARNRSQPHVPLQKEPATSLDSKGETKDEKKAMMDRMKPKEVNPAQQLKLRGQRVVMDPVTKSNVIISDAQFDTQRASHSYALDNPPSPDRSDLNSRPVPSAATPGNICLQPFPPPVPSQLLSGVVKPIQTMLYLFLASFSIMWWTTAFSGGIWAFLWRSLFFGTLGVVSFSQAGLLTRKIEKELEKVRFEMHRQRGIHHSPITPESTEWLNAFISTLMGLLNPDMFLPLADTIEDVMQASLPSFVDSVKVSDLGLGDTPFRILSMRALRDQPGDPEYPRDDWISGDNPHDPLVKNFKEDQSGDYVNYEIAFAYHAQPGKSDKIRARNIHLLIEFFVGVFDWVHIPIPIWIQIEGLAGTVRLRLQMIPEMPYVRNLTFTMMGVPKVSVSAKPMMKSIPNLLDLPVISGFVQNSIAAACAEYVAPKFMTMNIQEMLSGSGVKAKTNALGVIMVTIHHAVGLSPQDASGYSDPYIVLAYAKFGKPIYSTRIISEELNPVFEETAFLLLSDDEIVAKENLSVMLWDSDERSADDLVGRVELPVSEIIQNPNQLIRRTDKLQGFQDADDMPGELIWSVGYFSKVDLLSLVQKSSETKVKSETGDSGKIKSESSDSKIAEETTKLNDSTQDLTTKAPPSRQWPSGVLSIIVHHINNLERANLKGASGDREGAQGQDTAAPTEHDDNLPSGYCEIIVNDEMIYKTRVKQYTTMPFFEAGTEHFVRDWTETVIRIAVRDSRIREKDPLLGVINVDLEQLFEDAAASQVTRIFALQEGVGFGRAQVSILFESVQMRLPKNLLGWGTATLEITSSIRAELSDELAKYLKKKGQKLKLKTVEDTIKLPLVSPETHGSRQLDTNSVTWANDTQLPDYDKTLLRVPIYERYKCNITFQIGGASKIGSLISGEFNAANYVAVLWLHSLSDDIEQEIRLPILSGPKLTTLRQNFINDQTRATHDYEVVGYLNFKARLDPGLDPEHAKYARSAVARHTFEAYDNTEGQAEQAVRNAHALAHRKTLSGSSDSATSTNSDGHVASFRLSSIIKTKGEEEKAVEAAHKKSLSSRHRGAMQYGPVRTSIWMKEGIVRRARDLKNRINGKIEKEPQIATEGRA